MVTKPGATTKIGAAPPADLDLLKKRAERFGTVGIWFPYSSERPYTSFQATSSAVKSAELSEAIKRRQERFGVISKEEPKVGWFIFTCRTDF